MCAGSLPSGRRARRHASVGRSPGACAGSAAHGCRRWPAGVQSGVTGPFAQKEPVPAGEGGASRAAVRATLVSPGRPRGAGGEARLMPAPAPDQPTQVLQRRVGEVIRADATLALWRPVVLQRVGRLRQRALTGDGRGREDELVQRHDLGAVVEDPGPEGISAGCPRSPGLIVDRGSAGDGGEQPGVRPGVGRRRTHTSDPAPTRRQWRPGSGRGWRRPPAGTGAGPLFSAEVCSGAAGAAGGTLLAVGISVVGVRSAWGMGAPVLGGGASGIFAGARSRPSRLLAGCREAVPARMAQAPHGAGRWGR